MSDGIHLINYQMAMMEGISQDSNSLIDLQIQFANMVEYISKVITNVLEAGYNAQQGDMNNISYIMLASEDDNDQPEPTWGTHSQTGGYYYDPYTGETYHVHDHTDEVSPLEAEAQSYLALHQQQSSNSLDGLKSILSGLMSAGEKPASDSENNLNQTGNTIAQGMGYTANLIAKG